MAKEVSIKPDEIIERYENCYIHDNGLVPEYKIISFGNIVIDNACNVTVKQTSNDDYVIIFNNVTTQAFYFYAYSNIGYFIGDSNKLVFKRIKFEKPLHIPPPLQLPLPIAHQ